MQRQSKVPTQGQKQLKDTSGTPCSITNICIMTVLEERKKKSQKNIVSNYG